jgi:DNA-binding transcriptional ArsR family regulator
MTPVICLSGFDHEDPMKRSPQEIARAAQVFKALSHPQRLRVACQLMDGECPSQKQLVEELDLPQSTVARLLEPLRRSGLVVGVRRGAELHLSAQGEVLGRMLDAMCQLVHEQSGEGGGADADAQRTGNGREGA